MTATFKHHEADGLTDVVIKDHNHLYRTEDIVVLHFVFYRVEDYQFSPEEDEATYWLDVGASEHPTAPPL
ncbi:MAG: hypothetical protein V4689_11785 [Verrucomicrobiota bacterium]